jgi:hypothetical protein
MKHKALIRRLQISCLGLDPVDPLRLLVDDVIEALRENAMREVQRLGQEIEQEPVVGITAIRTWFKDGRVVTQTLCNSWVDTTPPQRTEQEPVAHPVIAGALFDFMGWLTSRKERIVLSSADNASPAADAIRDFANMRGLSLDDAKVQDWNTTPPQRTEQEPVAWMQVTKYGNKLLAFTEPPLEPPCYTGEFIAAKNYPLFLKKENT